VPVGKRHKIAVQSQIVIILENNIPFALEGSKFLMACAITTHSPSLKCRKWFSVVKSHGTIVWRIGFQGG